MGEILKLRADLAFCKELLSTKEVEVTFALKNLRALADPYEDKLSIDASEMSVLVSQIDQGVNKIRDLVKKIASLKKDLGEA